MSVIEKGFDDLVGTFEQLVTTIEGPKKRLAELCQGNLIEVCTDMQEILVPVQLNAEDNQSVQKQCNVIIAASQDLCHILKLHLSRDTEPPDIQIIRKFHCCVLIHLLTLLLSNCSSKLETYQETCRQFAQVSKDISQCNVIDLLDIEVGALRLENTLRNKKLVRDM